jgi:spore coat protein U-like protein
MRRMNEGGAANVSTLNRTLAALAGAIALGFASPSEGATKTGNVAITGTMTNPPPPASCTVNSPYVDASFEIPYESSPFSYSKTSSLSVNCTNTTPYSIRAASAQNVLSMGDDQLQVAVLYISNGSTKNLYNTPATGTGNGTAKVLPLTLSISPLNGSPFAEETVGPVSGSIKLTVTY